MVGKRIATTHWRWREGGGERPRSEFRGEWAGGRVDRCIIFSQFLFVLLTVRVQQADEDENSCCMYVCMYACMLNSAKT